MRQNVRNEFLHTRLGIDGNLTTTQTSPSAVKRSAIIVVFDFLACTVFKSSTFTVEQSS